jgi:hypothetical protein
VASAEWLHATVLWPVAPRQIVLTIPKMLRAYFHHDRRLLGELCRVAVDPLVCPDCGGAMQIVAFIEDKRVVRAILEHLSLWDETRPSDMTSQRKRYGPVLP